MASEIICGSAPPWPRRGKGAARFALAQFMLRCGIDFIHRRWIARTAIGNLVWSRLLWGGIWRSGWSGASAAGCRGRAACGSPVTCASSRRTSSALIGPKPGTPPGGVEVPRILGQADEVADRGIGRPGAAQRRARQIRGHAGGKESAGCRIRRRSNRSAAGSRDRKALALRRAAEDSRGGSAAASPALLRLRRVARRLRPRLRLRRAQRARKLSSPLIVVPRRAGPCRANASGSARSRWRFSKTCSTWCWATNAGNGVAQRFGHRHRLDDRLTRFGAALAFRRDPR